MKVCANVYLTEQHTASPVNWLCLSSAEYLQAECFDLFPQHTTLQSLPCKPMFASIFALQVLTVFQLGQGSYALLQQQGKFFWERVNGLHYIPGTVHKKQKAQP